MLTIGILYEPESINLQVTGGTGGVGGAGQVFNITHDTLMVEDAVGNITADADRADRPYWRR